MSTTTTTVASPKVVCVYNDVLAYFPRFEAEYLRLFPLDARTHQIKNDPETLRAVQEWFNSTNVFMGMITAIPPADIAFGSDAAANNFLLLHAHSIARTVLASICSLQRRPVPDQLVLDE